MKIHSVDLVPVFLPIEPHRTASGTVEGCPLVLMTVRTDEGVCGHGIVFCYMLPFLKTVYELSTHICKLIEGQELSPVSNTDFLFAKLKLIGTHGLVGMVLGGLDMALWDVKARAENAGLAQIIGVSARPVKPYANVGYDGIKDTADAAGRFAEAGFLGVKAKIGYPSLSEDLAVIRAMREAVGPDVALMVDYNQSLSVDEAVLRLRALAEEGLEWVEEPILAHDFAEYVALYGKTAAPIQAGENWFGPTDFATAIEAGVKDRVMPDAQKCLGITGWLRIMEMTVDREIRISSHLWPEVSAQLLSVSPNADWLEYVDWFNLIIKEPLKVTRGYTDIEGVIGTGVEFDADAVKKYTVL